MMKLCLDRDGRYREMCIVYLYHGLLYRSRWFIYTRRGNSMRKVKRELLDARARVCIVWVWVMSVTSRARRCPTRSDRWACRRQFTAGAAASSLTCRRGDNSHARPHYGQLQPYNPSKLTQPARLWRASQHGLPCRVHTARLSFISHRSLQCLYS